jgi:hypothetical protein
MKWMKKKRGEERRKNSRMLNGRKENAEEAKKRILAQVERLVGHSQHLSSIAIINPDCRLMRLPRFSRFLRNTILH